MKVAEQIFYVDSFTNRMFSGNPAAVVFLTEAKHPQWMQAIAAETGLSETAFILPLKEENHFHIWWFTPTVEAPLCGHATLAAAHVLWKHKVNADVPELYFTSCSGLLIAKEQDAWIELDFPTEEASKLDVVPAIIQEEFSDKIVFAGQNRIDYLVVLHDDVSVINYQPNFDKLSQLGRGIIISARSNNAEYDFISRVFAPSEGIPEDPVTGSAHCCLAPYWSAILKKNQMTGYQASKRGGVVKVHHKQARTLLYGQAVSVINGHLLHA
jgi:PhzF family phenazine biosynthesis protein